MKTRYPLIAIALLASSGQAADFSLANANTSDLERSGWKCEDCARAGSFGEIGASVGGVDSSNDHIANKFGATDGGFAALQANAQHQGQGTLSYQAGNLGMESGYGKARYQLRGLDARVAYAELYTVASDTATTSVRQPGDSFILGEEERRITLDKKRERAGLALDYDYNLFGLALRTFGDYRYEKLDGNSSNSLNNLDRRPVNYAEPVEYTHDRFSAGTELKGADWLASFSYLGSLFNNDQTGVYAENDAALKALAPENESHTLLGQANYALGNTRFSARFAREWLEQDEDYITGVGVPLGITHYNGDVDIMKGNARVTSVINKTLRLGARYDYYDRENNSPSFAFDQSVTATGSGNPVRNVTYDVTRHQATLDSYWRLTRDLRLDAGYFGKFIERSPAAREDTDENGLYGKLRFNPAAGHRLSTELRYSERDGSSYRDTDATGENNDLLRQYHLADRNRVALEFTWLVMPTDRLTVDVTGRYKEDDYDNTQIGLSDVQDYSYDVSASYALSNTVNLQAYGGQQWLDSEQEGSQQLASPDWSYHIDDQYRYVGAGIRWDGLMGDKLSLGADYLYSESDSDTDVQPGLDYGDYYQWSHSTQLFAEYLWRKNTSVRLDYRYERHRDFNFADVRNEDIDGLTTLGILGDRYNANLLMLSFTYSLQ